MGSNPIGSIMITKKVANGGIGVSHTWDYRHILVQVQDEKNQARCSLSTIDTQNLIEELVTQIYIRKQVNDGLLSDTEIRELAVEKWGSINHLVKSLIKTVKGL